MTSHTELILKQVSSERERQISLWGEQNHPVIDKIDLVSFGLYAESLKRNNDSLAKVGKLTYGDILMEEVYEALSEIDIDKQREEFIQVAAVAVAIVEMIDRKHEKI